MNDPRLQEAMRQHQAGNLDRATQLYKAVLATQPRDYHALYLLGFLHFQREDFEAAARLMQAALAVNAAAPDAFYNLGCALQKLNREEEAVDAFSRALVLKRDYSEALFNRGTSLFKLGRHAEALQSFEAALRLTPGDAEAWHNRGNALLNLKRIDEARASYEKALSLNRNLPFALGRLIYCKLLSCDWQGLDQLQRRAEQDVRAGKPAIAPLELALVSSSLPDLLAAARLWIARECPPAPSPLWRGERYGHERIRVAFLSADFRAHAVAYQFAGVLERLDRTRFDVYGFSYAADDGSDIRRRIASACELTDVHGKSDAEAAALLRAREIDIAVDLTGHTAGSRLGILAQRPAPVQVNYLGYPGTSGAPYIDYTIADARVIPPEQRRFYSEKAVTLPDTFFPVDDTRSGLAGSSRAAEGLPEEAVVFCSFNAISKLNPAIFAAWMRILSAVPGSVLWLADPGARARQNLAGAAGEHGIDSARMIFARYTDTADAHLARLPLADLFLDTLPYNAHATASDALWMGLPVLTCAGDSFAGRVAASLLYALDMPELVTESVGEYESRAAALASDSAQRDALREKLHRARKAAPLFDTARYTRHLEAAFAAMSARHAAGLAPDHLAVG